jgi:hypothetical protein
MAVDTLILSLSLRVIITFKIESLGHPEDITRAVIDTELAALASLFNDSDPTLCDLYGLHIKWNTPIFHLSSLPFESSFIVLCRDLLLNFNNLTGNSEFRKSNNEETA